MQMSTTAIAAPSSRAIHPCSGCTFEETHNELDVYSRNRQLKPAIAREADQHGET